MCDRLRALQQKLKLNMFPERPFFKCCVQDMRKCDLLIVMGTSLAVQPFASLVDRVSETTPRLLVNREKCGTVGGDWTATDKTVKAFDV